MSACPKCGKKMSYIEEHGQWYCYICKKYHKPQQPQQRTQHAQPRQPRSQSTVRSVAQSMPASTIWYQNYYRIRKKTLTIGNKYWIEDNHGNILGFSKQKFFKLKEDIRIYSDENMTHELFRIGQQQIMDMWGNFAVVDSITGAHLGYVKRKALKSGFIKDEWDLHNAANQQIGKIYEGTGRGLARKYIPGGKLIPEKVTLEIGGKPVAEIKQKFKIIGDIWELDCRKVPQDLDRRVVLSCILLMGMIERARK